MKNYIYLISGAVLAILWLIDIMSFFKIPEILEFIRIGYAAIGFFLSGLLMLEGWPTKAEDKTRKICSICGVSITRGEKSLHYKPSSGYIDTEDYCELCKNNKEIK